MKSTHRTRATRRGSVYVLILFTSMIVVAVGLSAMTVTRLQHRGEVGMADGVGAQTVALGGMEHAHHAIRLAIESVAATESDWRTVVTGNRHGPFAAGDGSFTWMIRDPSDDDLFDDPLDPVIIDVEAEYGTSQHKMNATLAPGPGVAGMSCLQSAIHAGGQITYDGDYLSSDGVVSTNADFVADSEVHADVRASGSVSGSTYYKTTVHSAAPLEMPGSSVFDYYLAHGTYVDVLPFEHVGSADGHIDVQDQVFTPFINPLGPANPEGIYILDAGGRHLKIKNSRIIGTLVVINTDPLKPTKIEKSLNWEPAFANYPALLIDGDVIFKLEDPPLSESLRLTNFNPLGAPFQGIENATQLDEFPNVIKGLFYVTGNVIFEEDNTNGEQYIEGVIIAGGDIVCVGNAEAHVAYDDTCLLDPPPGFAEQSGPHELVAGSFVRIVE